MTPELLQPGHTYTRQVAGHTAEFQVRSLDLNPSNGDLVAFGWYRRLPRTTWHPYSQAETAFDAWTDTTHHALEAS